jgi:hypothetical protein
MTSSRFLGKVFTHNHVEYLTVHDIQWTVDITGVKLRLNNLFNRNPVLGECSAAPQTVSSQHVQQQNNYEDGTQVSIITIWEFKHLAAKFAMNQAGFPQ